MADIRVGLVAYGRQHRLLIPAFLAVWAINMLGLYWLAISLWVVAVVIAAVRAWPFTAELEDADG